MKPQLKKNVMKGRKKTKKSSSLSALSVDEFLNKGFILTDSEDDGETKKKNKIIKKQTNGIINSKVNSAKDDLQDDASSEEDNEGEENGNSDEHEVLSDESVNTEDNNDEGDWTSEKFSHKKAISKLKDTDPEFYKFLEENDKDLLNFDESDSDDSHSDEERGGKVHELPKDLEVGSDESDYEGDSETIKDKRVITLKMVNEWREQLQSKSVKRYTPIKRVIQAFHAALMRVSNEEDKYGAMYIVTGSSVFNAIVQLCIQDLEPAIKNFLEVPSGALFDPSKNKKNWPKIQKSVQFYLRNIIKLLSGVSSSHIQGVLLKHLRQMIPFVVCFIHLRHPLLKILVKLWSSSEETVRVISFLCLLRLTRFQQEKILDKVLKMMYLAYVRNSKFVSPSTLPVISFMRCSLVEMFALDVSLAYRHVFLYIRQLAIHLRNAVTLQKKENMQAVYNWQYINSLHLWADLMVISVNKPLLQPLLYPLVQVTLGTIKLIPTAQYYPLRFHCLQILINLSKQTCTYIPILPYILEILDTYDFNKAHKKVSMKPMDFTCVLRLSKSQLQENGFKDTVIGKIYQQLLEYLSNESHSIAFPDLVIPTIIQLKRFLKTCKVSNYCRKMKQILDKIEENCRFVTNEYGNVSFTLSDQKSIVAWETQLQLKGSPLTTFYNNWSKVNALQESKKLTQNEKLGDFKLPVLKKRPNTVKPKPEGPVELFPSDESDTDDLLKSEEVEEPKKKRKRNNKNKKSQKVNITVGDIESDIPDTEDLVEDLKLEDLDT